MRAFTSSNNPISPASILRSKGGIVNNNTKTATVTTVNHPPELQVPVHRKDGTQHLIPVWFPLSIMAASAARVVGEREGVAQIAREAVICHGDEVAKSWNNGGDDDVMSRVIEAANRASDAVVRAGGSREGADAVESAVREGGTLLLLSSRNNNSNRGNSNTNSNAVVESRDENNATTRRHTNERNDETGRDGPASYPRSLVTLNRALDAEIKHNNSIQLNNYKNDKRGKRTRWKEGSITSRGSSVFSHMSNKNSNHHHNNNNNNNNNISMMNKKCISWRDDDPSLTLFCTSENENDSMFIAMSNDQQHHQSHLNMSGKEIHLTSGEPQMRSGGKRDSGGGGGMKKSELHPIFEIPSTIFEDSSNDIIAGSADSRQNSNINNIISNDDYDGNNRQVASPNSEEVFPTPFFSWNALLPSWKDNNNTNQSNGGYSSVASMQTSTSMAPLFNILSATPPENAYLHGNNANQKGVIDVFSHNGGGGGGGGGGSQTTSSTSKNNSNLQKPQQSFESRATFTSGSAANNFNSKSHDSKSNYSINDRQSASQYPGTTSPFFNTILPTTLLPAWDAQTLLSMRTFNTNPGDGQSSVAPLMNLLLPIPPTKNNEKLNKNASEKENTSNPNRATLPDKKKVNSPKTKPASAKRDMDEYNTATCNGAPMSSPTTTSDEEMKSQTWIPSSGKGEKCKNEVKQDKGASATSASRFKSTRATSIETSYLSTEVNDLGDFDVFTEDYSIDYSNQHSEFGEYNDEDLFSEIGNKSITTRSIISRQQKRKDNCCCQGLFRNDEHDEDDAISTGDTTLEHSDYKEDEEKSNDIISKCESGFYQNVEVGLDALKLTEKTKKNKSLSNRIKCVLSKLNCAKQRKHETTRY